MTQSILEVVKTEIYKKLEQEFMMAAMHELTEDMENYKKSLEVIVKVATVLGINTRITRVSIELIPQI